MRKIFIFLVLLAASFAATAQQTTETKIPVEQVRDTSEVGLVPLSNGGTGVTWGAQLGGIQPTDAPGGDLDGTYASPLVIGFNGRPISLAAPSPGDAYVWDGSAFKLTGIGQVQSISNTNTVNLALNTGVLIADVNVNTTDYPGLISTLTGLGFDPTASGTFDPTASGLPVGVDNIQEGITANASNIAAHGILISERATQSALVHTAAAIRADFPIGGTDDQTLDLTSNTLSIESGNSVNLSGYLDNTDDQTLSINDGTRVLTIEDGNTVDFSEAIMEEVASFLTAGTNVTVTHNDGANTLTIDATGGGAAPVNDTEYLFETTTLGVGEIGYSLQRLHSANTQMGVVRRSTDGATDTLLYPLSGSITLESSLSGGAKLGDWSQGGDVTIKEWFNQGNGGNLVQNNSSLQPFLVTGGKLRTVDGMAAVYFDGTRYMANSDISMTMPNSWSIVMKFNDSDTYTNNYIPIDAGPAGTNRQIPIWVDREIDKFKYFTGDNVTIDDAVLFEKMYIFSNYTTSNQDLYFSTIDQNVINSGSNSMGGLTLGARFSASSILLGYIQEVVAWDVDGMAERYNIHLNTTNRYETPETEGYSDSGGEPQSFTLLKRYSDIGASQGVASDGGYLYVTGFPPGYTQGHDFIMKFNKNGALVAQNASATTDGILQGTQVNGIFVKDSLLYVGCNNYANPQTPAAASAIKVFRADDLSYVTEYPVRDNITEGYVWHNGYWWGVYNDLMIASQRDENFDLVAEHTLTYPITGGFNYQGIVWIDDYILCTVHDGTSTPQQLDVYEWNGSGFDEVKRMTQINPSQTGQGIYKEPNEDILWWAERSWPNAENNVVKTRINYVLPANNN